MNQLDLVRWSDVLLVAPDLQAKVYYLQPREVAYFTSIPIPDLLSYLSSLTHSQPQFKQTHDEYLETTHGSDLLPNGSLRIRKYVPSAPEYFIHVLAVFWEESEQFPDNFPLRSHEIIAQEFVDPDGSLYEKMMKQLTRNHIKPILYIDKKRYSFELKPEISQESKYKPLVEITQNLIGNHQACMVKDVGLKILVDEFPNTIWNNYNQIIEIEFDDQHLLEAQQLVHQINIDFPNRLIPKEFNKITYHKTHH